MPEQRAIGLRRFSATPALSLVTMLALAGPATTALGQDDAAQPGQSPEADTQAAEQTDMDLEDVTVYGEAQTSDQLVGPYEQPAWTARQQRFPTTRAYVLPPGVFEFESFASFEENEGDGSGPEWELQQELKIGLPYRTQLDLYYISDRPAGGELESSAYKIEVRHAFADWGELPLNPTAYVEYEAPFEGDEGNGTLEYKLLLAETLAPKTHFATNLIFEHDLQEDKIEYGVSGGLSYTLVENTFSAGVEGEIIKEDAGPEQKVETIVGPSFEWRPTNNTSFRVAPLFGIGSDSPDIKTFFVFGIGFGPGEGGDYIGPAGAEMR